MDTLKSQKTRKRSKSDEGTAMVLNRREAAAAITAATAELLFLGRATAQEIYPSRPIKVIIGFAAGSGSATACSRAITRSTLLSAATTGWSNAMAATAAAM